MSYDIEVFNDNDLNANTYLISNETSCIIIDPANNLKILEKYINNKKVLGILITHGHYDHFKCLKELLKKHPTTVYMHEEAHKKMLNPALSYAKMFGCATPTIIDEDKIKYVKDGTILNLGEFVIKCWYTPGHTNCMMSYIVDDNLFSGDFIFRGSIGRTDLETSDKSKMFISVTELKRRKTNYHIYPGHEQDTTLSRELNENIYLLEHSKGLIWGNE